MNISNYNWGTVNATLHICLRMKPQMDHLLPTTLLRRLMRLALRKLMMKRIGCLMPDRMRLRSLY
ncbi:ORF966 protein [Gallid alphaherpesvirus 3]|uniref:ORF966 protein n=1 Tax=Gallid alphaherpesvirus 3 TaxID=35250 RepID=F8TC59_9ALPH|nr:ORF966 protein [Gallid alphaherpesvirus 3]AEI00270.1 ORF966 protein [Gallid alphaherpesvirus 3]QEY02327.1 ORF966 protein [Gallid alphaherpesvirus 3]